MALANAPPDRSEYSVDELTAVAQLFGSPDFPGVGGEAFAEHSDSAREAALQSARRSLLARGVIGVAEDGQARMTGAHAALFGIALAPSVVCTAQHRVRGAAETRLYYARSDLSVEHSAVLGNVYRLRRVPTDQLLQQVLAFVKLTNQPARQASTLTVPRSTFDRVRDVFLTRDVEEVRTAVPADAGPLLDLLTDFVSTSQVRCVHRSGGRLVGGELTWIDAGKAGLWRVDASEADAGNGEPPTGEARVFVSPTTARTLAGTLLDYLPRGAAAAEAAS
jgi:hypothetical protein